MNRKADRHAVRAMTLRLDPAELQWWRDRAAASGRPLQPVLRDALAVARAMIEQMQSQDH